jgi:DNA-directed RNA polymerase specialized sigma24 family protein
MTDEDALLFLAAGDAKDKEVARDYLATKYVPYLIAWFARNLPHEPTADHAAGETLIRLFRTAEKRSALLPHPEKLRAWLLAAAARSMQDARRRNRGRQQAQVKSLDQALEDPDFPEPSSTDKRTPADADMARAALDCILALDQPGRGILLFDALGEITELTDSEHIELHADTLIDCTQAFGVYSRDALRAHRTRAREAVAECLTRKGHL